MKHFFIASFSSLILFTLICNAAEIARPILNEQLPLLPFKPVPVDTSQSSKLNFSKEYSERIHKLFEKDTNIVSTYKKFHNELPNAQKEGTSDILFSEFASSPAIVYRNKQSTDSLKKISKLWVKDALAEKDESIRFLYSQYSDLLRNNDIDFQYFYTENQQIRPGEELKIHGNGIYGANKKSIKYYIEIARLDLDEKLKPKSFSMTLSDTTTFGNYDDIYKAKFEKPGVYRITVYNDFQFRQFYLQVSLLDCAVKFDLNKLLISASTYKDTLPPPYTVHFVNAAGDIFVTKTDTNGVCAMRHQFSKYLEQYKDLKILVEKNGQLAFLQGVNPYIDDDTLNVCYIYTDRPVYRPGQKVHFSGLLKILRDQTTLITPAINSIVISISDPQYANFYNDTLTVDRWGHFGDSITLSNDSKQGSYMITVNEAESKTSINSYRYSRCTFTVDSYKKPEFEISVTPEKETYLIGEKAELKVNGKYYFGGPLANIPIKVRWYRQGLYHFFDSWGESKCRFFPSGEKEFIKEENYTLDNAGNCTLQWFQDPKGQHEYGYLIAEVIASDQSRREVREEGKLQIVKYDAYLSVIPDKYEYESGENAKLEFIAVDMKGKALSGSLNLRIKKDNEIISEETIPIGTNGRCEKILPLKETGSYTIEISAKDISGKTAYVESNIQVVKNRIWNWDWERIEITSDKKEYTVGDTAHITVHTGADETKALCTVEGHELSAYNVIKLENHTLEYLIPITKQLSNNINFSILFSSQSRMASSSYDIRVIDSTLLLNVKLRSDKTFKPGDQFKGKFSITNMNGKPVQSSFSIALVDEAIYDVAALLEKAGVYGRHFYKNPEEKDGILSMLPQYYGNHVSLAFNEFTPSFIGALDNISHGDVPAGGKVRNIGSQSSKKSLRSMPFGTGYGGGFAEAAPAPMLMKQATTANVDDIVNGDTKNETEPPRERKDFKDLGYWNPSVTTDTNGKADISFILPDDLTRWRLVLIGSDGDTHLIDFKDSIITKQDVMVKLESPRGFVVDDSTIIAEVVHNYSEKPAHAKITLDIKAGQGNVAIQGINSDTMTIESGATKRIDWPVKVIKNGSVTLSVTAITDKGSDLETRTYPVRFHGIQRTANNSGVLSESHTEEAFTFLSQKDAMPGSRNLTISYSPTLVYTMFESLDYLTGYPYGCVEQTMSRFLPNLYVASAMKKLNLRNDSLLKKIPEYTHAGLDRLQKFQHPDGGWGWWESDNTDPQMTATVLDGLAYAMHSDISDPDKKNAQVMYERGCKSTMQLIKISKELPNTLLLSHALISSPLFKDISKEVMNAYSQRGNLSSYELSLLLDCLKAQNRITESKKIIELIETKAIKAGGAIYWERNTQFSWYRQNEEATAKVIESLSKYDSDNPLLSQAVTWLSRQKRNGYWISTKTTAAVIEALSLYLEKTNELNPDFKGTISVNGKEITSFHVQRESLSKWQGLLILPDSLLQKENTVKFSMNGEGRLYYSCKLDYTSGEKPIKERDSGISVTRSYTKIVYNQDKNGDWKVRRVPFDGKLKCGDEIEVSVTIKTNKQYEHMMLEDFFPSGMQVLHKEKEWYHMWCIGWWWGYTHEEARDDRMVFFVDRLSNGSRTFNYLLRAETPGTYIGLPARAELMYEPEISGNSDETGVVITD